jgi:hypothetical protein
MYARLVWLLSSGASFAWLAGCTDADCVTPGCEPLPHDGATPDSRSDDAGSADAGDDAGAECRRWLPIECPAGACPDPASVTLGLSFVGAAGTGDPPALESVAFVPGSDDRAVAMSAENHLVELFYDDTGPRFGRIVTVDVPGPLSYATAVRVHPSARYAAISIADADCAPGEVLLVDIGDAFGTVLGRLTVGYAPDNFVFSEDGRWLVTADEDGRAARPCKPADRFGGSITFVATTGDPTAAEVSRTVVVDHAMDSEPESVVIGSSGTVVVTLQDTDEIVVLSLDDAVEPRVLSVPPGGSPDGVAVEESLGVAVAGLEHTDDLAVIDLATGALVQRVDLVTGGFVPPEYNRDAGDADEQHEPEQMTLVRHLGARFVLFPLQESHAAMAFRLPDDAMLVFDSIAPVGVGYGLEMGGRGRSRVGPEGIAVRQDVGLVLVASERESSITLLRTAASRYGECP